MTMFLKYKSTFAIAITISIALILGNLVPVFSVENHTKHDTHASMQNHKKASIEDDGVHLLKNRLLKTTLSER